MSEANISQARDNGTTVLEAAMDHPALRELIKAGRVDLRLGHGTHLDLEGTAERRSMLHHLAVLGAKLEHNNQSNWATGVDPKLEIATIQSVVLRNAVYMVALNAGVLAPSRIERDPIVVHVSTDSNGVMGAEMSDNFLALIRTLNDLDLSRGPEHQPSLSPTASGDLELLRSSSSSEGSSVVLILQVQEEAGRGLGVVGLPELSRTLSREQSARARASLPKDLRRLRKST